MGNFASIFSVGPSGEDPDDEPVEHLQPEWVGPPGDELGASLPLGAVIGRSKNAVVALRQLTGYSTGVMLDLVAAARGLRESETNRLFHEQHATAPEEGPPGGFLRVGVELEDGTRASNLADPRRLWRADRTPEGPLLMRSGGGCGSAGSGHVTMNPGYWLWPLPPPGRLRLFVERPSLDVELSSIELDGAAIVAAAARSRPLWDA